MYHDTLLTKTIDHFKKGNIIISFMMWSLQMWIPIVDCPSGNEVNWQFTHDFTLTKSTRTVKLKSQKRGYKLSAKRTMRELCSSRPQREPDLCLYLFNLPAISDLSLNMQSLN